VEEEGVQPFAAADDLGEGGDDFGVVKAAIGYSGMLMVCTGTGGA
jgi:hypothetical protein